MTNKPSAELILHSSYADITVKRATGEIISIDYENFGGEGNEWNDVARFDPKTLSATEPEDDILYCGFWTKDGVYVQPVL